MVKLVIRKVIRRAIRNMVRNTCKDMPDMQTMQPHRRKTWLKMKVSSTNKMCPTLHHHLHKWYVNRYNENKLNIDYSDFSNETARRSAAATGNPAAA